MKIQRLEKEGQGYYWDALVITLEPGEKIAVYKAILRMTKTWGVKFNDVEIKVMYKKNPQSQTASLLHYRLIKYNQLEVIRTEETINKEYSDIGQYILQIIFYQETKASITSKMSWEWEYKVTKKGEKPVKPPKKEGPFDEIIENIKQLFLVALVLVGLWIALSLKIPQKIAEVFKKKGG
jgi:hypothetical protein